jgi:hypothetical protein
MELLVTPLVFPQENFIKEAKRKGGLLGRLLVREPFYQMTLEYKAYYRVSLPHYIEARRVFTPKKKVSGTAHMIVDAETGKCAVITETLDLTPASGKVFQYVQAQISPEEAIDVAKRYANKVLLRLSGGMPVFKDHSIIEFYRPHWIAYYGDPTECTNPRYLPFEADGLSFNR